MRRVDCRISQISNTTPLRQAIFRFMTPIQKSHPHRNAIDNDPFSSYVSPGGIPARLNKGLSMRTISTLLIGAEGSVGVLVRLFSPFDRELSP